MARRNRFKTNQAVDNATYNRTLNRMSALNNIPSDLEKNSKITGSDARRVKRLLRQQRSTSAGGAANVASKAQTYQRAKTPKPRYGAKQTVDDATMDRTYGRLNRLSKMGVDTSKLAVGYGGSGGQSRKVKALLRRAKAKKTTYSI